MKNIEKRTVRTAAWLLSLSLFLPLGATPAPAQQAPRRAIVVSAEQPSVWTLEQAHYLLAQMHRRNLDLKATGLGELDPNEINGLNFDVMRTLVEFGVTFDDAARFNNSLLTRDRRFDAERAIRLQTRRDQLADQSLALNRDVARLERERAMAPEGDKAELAARIAELTAVRDANNAEVTRLDNDLKTATGPTGEVAATEPPAATGADKLPQSTFDEAFKSVTKSLIERFNQAPKLNASLRLDNFLQMQYEIIAKQLTLLRDEVGPGERIIFLEMPQTVNAAHDKADKKWAQSWWQITGYTKPPTEEDDDEPTIRRWKKRGSSGGNEGDESQPAIRKTRNVVQSAIAAYKSQNPQTFVSLNSANSGEFPVDDRTVRTIELIPRQSSLNVNDIKLRARTGVLTAVAKTLFGIGARLNVQRQRETFSQFVQQELYSSGFGKGAREFGWTFTPMPGTDRVMSGARTTYAVMVVPVEAEALVLKSAGCYFPRSEYQPTSFADTGDAERWTDRDRQSRNCSEQKTFIVPIPGGGNEENDDFWVDGLEYVPAEKSDRITLLIYGKNFPSQVGVMVDGIPLTQSIGVAQPLIRDDSTAFAEARNELKDAKLGGRFERVDDKQIVAVFERPNGKDGTQPTITLTAPGKAKILNRLRLFINGVPNSTLDTASLLFGRRPPPKDAFRIDKVEVFRSRTRGFMTALVSGAGFAMGQTALINGSPAAVTVESPQFLTAEFRVPSDEKIRLVLVDRKNTADPADDETTLAEAVANPALLRVTDVEVIGYEPADEEEDEPAILTVKITGSGFTDDLRASVGQLAVKSAAEAILKVTESEARATVTLFDTQTRQEARIIITRKTQPQK
jgi:hypothetical protein